MNNKPVAWIDKETGCFVYNQYDYEDLDEHGKDGLIALYTHPAKTLTDEEIKAVYGEYFDVENFDWLHLQCIQAILKKASEK